MSVKKDKKTKWISIRISPSDLEMIDKEKLNKSNLFNEKLKEIKLKSTKLIEFKKKKRGMGF